MTLDAKIRFTFGYTDCMNLIIKLILHFPEPIVGKELISLAANLANNQRNADLLNAEEIRLVV